MYDKDFLYLQYNDLDWSQQADTGLNGFINDYIIDELIPAKPTSELRVFDIGFGIGSFIRSLVGKLNDQTDLYIEGCEPSERNYSYLTSNPPQLTDGVTLKTHPSPFLKTETEVRFDFITAIYVFPHIPQDELDDTARKIRSMLKAGGLFIMVVASEHYLKEKLESNNGAYTLLQKNEIDYLGHKYAEVLHYTDIPGIGRILDHSREEAFYLRFFEEQGFRLLQKTDLEDCGYTCTVFVFQKN